MYNPDGQIVEEDGEGMSITDPMEADEALLSKSNLFFSWMKKYGVYLLLVAIAFLRGAAYANLLPAWGIIDEEQHLHYIQYLAEEKRRQRRLYALNGPGGFRRNAVSDDL